MADGVEVAVHTMEPPGQVRPQPVHSIGRTVFRLVRVDGALAVLVFLFAWAFTRSVGVPFDPLFRRTFTLFESILFSKLLVIGSIAILIHMARIGKYYPRDHSYQWSDIWTHLGRSFLTPANVFALLRALALLLLITAAVSNVKPLIPLVTDRIHDALLLKLDLLLFAGADPYVWLSKNRTPLLTTWLNYAYISLFFFFCLSITLLFVQKRLRELRVLVLSMLLAKLLGNAVHFAMPSLGDVYIPERVHLYENFSKEPMVRDVQKGLWANRVLLLADREKWSPGNPFAGIAAFPSLHCALFTVMILLAWRSHWWMLPIYVPVGILMTFSTLYFGWHYISDCIAGVLLGAGAVYASYRLLDWEVRLERRWTGTAEERLPSSERA